MQICENNATFYQKRQFMVEYRPIKNCEANANVKFKQLMKNICYTTVFGSSSKQICTMLIPFVCTRLKSSHMRSIQSVVSKTIDSFLEARVNCPDWTLDGITWHNYRQTQTSARTALPTERCSHYYTELDVNSYNFPQWNGKNSIKNSWILIVIRSARNSNGLLLVRHPTLQKFYSNSSIFFQLSL